MSKPLPPDPTAAARRRSFSALTLVKSRPWTIMSLAIFLVTVAVLSGCGLRLASAVLLGFDLAALVFLGFLARLFNRATPARMRDQTHVLDTGRWVVLWSGVVLSAVVLVALGNELHVARSGGLLELALGVSSVVLSWLFLNVMFAVHYAHGYYGDFGDKHTGLEFPHTPAPDYWDFTYFSIVIGMTFQVSDVQISSSYLRRVVLLHSIIAFFFNVFIIAITVNIVAGQGG
jgi:uncharacterized membrane protein